MIDWTAIILAVIGLGSIALQGYIAYRARIVVAAVENIHVAVNSERERMLAEVAGLKEEIRALAAVNASLTTQLKQKRK